MGTSILTNGLQTVISAVSADQYKNFDYESSSYLRKAAGTTGEVRWLLYYTRPFPLGATITNAKVVLYSASTAQTGTLTLTAKRLNTPVSFSKVTWATRPITYYSGTATSTKTGPVALNAQWDFDVTAMMQSVSLGDPWYGLEISTASLDPGLRFFGPTYANTALRPRLEITWSDTPDRPRSLAPSGSRAISGTKPIVRGDYVDITGDVAMQAIQVQTSASTSFTSPTFDSGTVTSSVPELDLSTTAFVALTDGQVVYWRMRVQDAAGLWSEWSDVADFKRDIKGTLTLTSPSSGTPTVEDSTPPISWTFTGETQAAFQIVVTGTVAATGQRSQWTSGKITSTATTYTLPTGVITSPDLDYEITLRVWDSKQRESLPNDPAYAEVVRSFTYVPTATVTATTSPTATLAYPYPRVVVGWQRATDPDSFSILRNRQVIVSGLVPADVRVSGTTFSWVDKSASPQTTLLYEVQAIVNNKASASNPTVSTTMTSAGIWLADSDRTNEVLIYGRADRGFGYGESSEVLEVVGGTEVVLVTQSLRGIEGTITGELHGGAAGIATTAQQWRDKLLAIKAKPGRKCWLTFGDTTIQCVVRNVAISPRPAPKLSFAVSFDFYQVGTLQPGFVPTL